MVVNRKCSIFVSVLLLLIASGLLTYRGNVPFKNYYNQLVSQTKLQNKNKLVARRRFQTTEHRTIEYQTRETYLKNEKQKTTASWNIEEQTSPAYPETEIVSASIFWNAAGETTPVQMKSEDKIDILLLSYARGGSTYVGQIIGHHNDVFYFYEPLYSDKYIHKYFKTNSVCEMNNTTCTWVSPDEINLQLKKLENIYKCTEDAFIMKDFQRTLGGYKLNNDDLLQSNCVQSKARFAKVLRIGGDLLESLLQHNSNLRVVYLYRDPRGIINSRLKSRFKENWKRDISSVKSLADGLCKKMQSDTNTVVYLKEKYPDKIYMIGYENIAQFPTESSKNIFDFLNLNVSEEYLKVVSNMGKKHPEADNVWNTAYRSDGYATSIKWKDELSKEDKKDIDKSCMMVYKLLGYDV